MNKGKAAIIIVNWNGLKFLNDCLTSVYAQTYKNFDVYFVDNGSKDESVSFTREHFPNTKIISLDHNTGFAKGNNIGIKAAFEDKEIEYIVCLNNDTIVEKDWLKGLVEEVFYNEKIDMVGSLSFLPDGNVYSIGARFNKNLNDLSIGYGDDPKKYTEKRDIFSPHGVSALYTRRLLEEVGLFDEDFFAYCEEFDLGLRARNRGYKAVFTPKSRLVHLVSQSSGGMANPFKAFLNKRNSYFVAIKNFTLVDLVAFPFRDLFWSIKNARSKEENSVTLLKSKVSKKDFIFLIIRIYRSIFYYLPSMFIKRHKDKKF